MSKKFIVLVDEAFTTDERNTISKYLKDKFGYWHWIGNAWLLITSRDTDTSQNIRDELIKLVNRGTIIVLDISNNNGWAGFGNTKKFEWMHKNWGKKSKKLTP
ncbi:hypothetical protein DDU33_03510 [Actinobacillus porcitonsillarum]|uniref:SinR family protein n=1 Tax=Actinobacillus porcitonsillarum TaxID=189834 RepID=A0A2U8FJC3_9PAST|nr:hypothetical protein [Actinobacillus porcitonsillarum]AWI50616.1 hypothetical protein DDU33_03510 [Actinobacillus porcitonsillarum]